MASLGSSVASLRSSLSLLTSTIDLLDSGVSDLPRLRKVLATQQHFELLPEPSLYAAQQSILKEITPAITTLLGTAEAHIAELGRREESLKARRELLDGRLDNEGGQKSENRENYLFPRLNTEKYSKLVGERNAPSMVELKKLKQRKARLQYAVSRLELESRQRQRDLRKSMAAVNEP